jgi:phosphoribosylglycinamide formyltransferase-1
MARTRVAVLISGRGSNMAALIEAAKDPSYPAEIVLVVSNRPEAAGLAHAKAQGVATAVVDHRPHGNDRSAFEHALQGVLDEHRVQLVCLGGFMRLFTAPFALRWEGRILNIHPSLLPAFPGLDPHGQALRAGVKISGATVHFVVPETDAGPIVAQAAVPVLGGDDIETLAARVLAAEHRLYPLALALVAAARVRIVDGRCLLEGADQAAATLLMPASK